MVWYFFVSCEDIDGAFAVLNKFDDAVFLSLFIIVAIPVLAYSC
jgi:hypothetical protein